MKKLSTLTLLLVLFSALKGFTAPLVGTITVPGFISGYGAVTTLKDVVDALNAEGVGALGVTININYSMLSTETAPAGGYILGSDVLNASTDLSRPIRFNCRGLLVTASSGSGSNDAIFTIEGADHITIDSLFLQESSANTTATTMMERGFSIVKRASNDGCKGISIRYCQVTLNNTNATSGSGVVPFGTMGIFVGNCTRTSGTAFTPTSDSGTHDNFFFTQNLIKNVHHGIYFYGNAVTADGSAFNDRNTYVSENHIQNFTHHGIYYSYFNNDVVDHNTIENTAGGGTAPTANSIFGIRYYNPSTALQTNTTWTCTKNVVNLKINTASNNNAVGIFSQVYGTSTTNITNDTVSIISEGATAMLAGIFSQNHLGTQNITGNHIHDFTTQSTNEQPVLGIFVGGYSVYSGLGLSIIERYPDITNTNNNIIEDFSVCAFYPIPLPLDSSSRRVVAILDDNIRTTSTSSIVRNVSGNTIKNMEIINRSWRFTGYGSMYSYGAFNPSFAYTTNFKNNRIEDIFVSGSSNRTPIFAVNTLGTFYHGHTFNSEGNNVRGIAASSNIAIGFDLEYQLQANMDKDTIIDLYSADSTAAAIVYGITAYNPKTVVIKNCYISDITSDGLNSRPVDAGGMLFINGSTIGAQEVTLRNNVVKNIYNGSTAGGAFGIASANGTASFNIDNNMISDIAAPSNTAIYSSGFGMYLVNSGVNNVYYNTIKLISDASGASDFGATGILYSSGAKNTFQNNILHVNVLAGTGNNVSAMRGRAGTASSGPSLSGFTAGSNIYYTPTGPNNYLYVEGTTNASLVNGYHLNGLTENTAKNILNDPYFNSDCDQSIYHNFMQGASPSREVNTYTEDNLGGSAGVFVPSGLSYAEGAAIDAPISVDFAASARPAGSSDIGALEFTGSVRPQMEILVTSSTGYDTACTFNLPNLSASIDPYFNRVSYQWYRDTTKIPGATGTSITVTPLSGDYTVKVFDSLTGCEHSSEAFHITIVPPPPAIVTYYDSLAFCEGSAVVLQANKGYRYTYQWSRDFSPLPGETNDHLVAAKAGDYTVEVNTPLGCPSFSLPIRVKVYPLPTPTVVYVSRRELTTQKYFLYQWYKNNVKIDSFSTSRSYYTLEDGAYSVEVTDSNGCTAKSDVYLFSMGIDPQELRTVVRIYPNPVSDLLHVESPVTVKAVLADITGKTIVQVNEIRQGTIDVSSLAKGVYMLSLQDEDGRAIVTQKVNKY